LELLEDNFPETFRFTTAVFPSQDDDVITSPYNSILALNQLIDHADCVLPIDNQSLIDISNKLIYGAKGYQKVETQPASVVKTKKSHPFDTMNTIAANLLLNLTW
jgi:tubulin epsilon